MPIEPPIDERQDAAPPKQTTKTLPPLERSRFGGTQRRHERPADDDDAPVSRSDLSKGPEEIIEHHEAYINWSVLLISSAVILAFSIWAMLIPEHA